MPFPLFSSKSWHNLFFLSVFQIYVVFFFHFGYIHACICIYILLKIICLIYIILLLCMSLVMTIFCWMDYYFHSQNSLVACSSLCSVHFVESSHGLFTISFAKHQACPFVVTTWSFLHFEIMFQIYYFTQYKLAFKFIWNINLFFLNISVFCILFVKIVVINVYRCKIS